MNVEQSSEFSYKGFKAIRHFISYCQHEVSIFLPDGNLLNRYGATAPIQNKNNDGRKYPCMTTDEEVKEIIDHHLDNIKETDTTYPHLSEVRKILRPLGYSLSYSRPVGSEKGTVWKSSVYPSFRCGYLLNDVQLIWNRNNDREIFLNYGNAAGGIKEITAALTANGFTIIQHNPNK